MCGLSAALLTLDLWQVRAGSYVCFLVDTSGTKICRCCSCCCCCCNLHLPPLLLFWNDFSQAIQRCRRRRNGEGQAHRSFSNDPISNIRISGRCACAALLQLRAQATRATLLFVTPVVQLRCRIRLRFAGTCLVRCAPSVAEFCVRCDCSTTKALSNEHGSLSLLLAMLQLNEQIVFIAILQRKLMAFTAGV